MMFVCSGRPAEQDGFFIVKKQTTILYGPDVIANQRGCSAVFITATEVLCSLLIRQKVY